MALQLLLFCSILCSGQNNDSISISVIQPAVYMVKNEWSQQLNFDLCIENKRPETIELKRVELEAYDKKGHFICRKTLEDGPLAPSLKTIPVRQIQSNEKITLFNPFTIYIWGNTVYAPASGKVIAINNQSEDNKPGTLNFRIQDPKLNRDLFTGNCVAIDHLNGEYRFLVHLQKGSVIVKEGICEYRRYY